MLDDTVIEELRNRLLAEGSAIITDSRDRRLFLIHSKLLKMDFDGVIAAYEGAGAFVFDLGRPVNKFRLINSGFEIAMAEAVSDLINRMTGVTQPSTLGIRRRAITQAPKKE